MTHFCQRFRAFPLPLAGRQWGFAADVVPELLLLFAVTDDGAETRRERASGSLFALEWHGVAWPVSINERHASASSSNNVPESNRCVKFNDEEFDDVVEVAVCAIRCRRQLFLLFDFRSFRTTTSTAPVLCSGPASRTGPQIALISVSCPSKIVETL